MKRLGNKGDQMEWKDKQKRQIRYGSWGYWCNIFQQTKWKQRAMFEPCVSWRETSISMDVCCEAKRKLLCQTTYPAVGVQSSEDYWNANVNDSGRRQSFSRRHNVTGWMRLSRIKPNSPARCDVGTFFFWKVPKLALTVGTVQRLLRYDGAECEYRGRRGRR